jgi:hypothetical protein
MESSNNEKDTLDENSHVKNAATNVCSNLINILVWNEEMY